MSVSDQTSPEVTDEVDDLDEQLNDFTVVLSLPVRAESPEDAVDAMLQDCIDNGMKNYIFTVTDEVTGVQFFVGREGLLTAADVERIGGQTQTDVDALDEELAGEARQDNEENEG